MPKLTAEFERLACQQGAIEYVAHDRVPFFIVESIPVIGEEEIECYSETYKGVQYVKMDSTHKNADGSLSGAEPTYSASMNQERQALWAEQYELVTVDQMKELRRLDALWQTLEGAKIAAKEQIKAAFDEIKQQGFYSDCQGEMALYESTEKRTTMLMGQALTAAVNKIKLMADPDAETSQLAWRRLGETKCYDWTDEEILKCAEDLQQTIQMVQLMEEDIDEQIDAQESIELVKAVMENAIKSLG